MRFGIFGFGRAPYGELARRFRLAEELGFASAWVDDDLLVPQYSDFEPWTLLGALARDTGRIRLGTMVTAITFRHPSFLVAQVVALDHVSGGRAELGLGAGGYPHPYAAFSQHPWTPRERAERLEEQAAIIGPLLRGERVTRAGPHYPVTDAQAPPAVQRPRPPFTVAAHGARGLRTVARHADGWNSLGGQPYSADGGETHRVTLAAAAAETRRLSERLDGFCRELGRDPATVWRSVQALTPAPDPFASLDAFDEYAGTYRAIGIDELIFYWPPIELIGHRGPVPPELQARFERIAAQRVLPADRSQARDGDRP
jgi:alkanesulfonate monooxygenase SsuD/methylene tetrahydromethanopterin reductase-like flavin-dependent oxidoreductase (luciferase family)